MPITLLDTEYATLWYYPEDKIVRHQFKKFIYGEHFRGFMLASVDAFEKYGCHKYLSDDRLMTAFHPDDSVWSRTVFTPRMLQAGWTHWALLLPTRAIGQAFMTRVIQQVRAAGIAGIATFDSVEDALAWLKAQ